MLRRCDLRGRLQHVGGHELESVAEGGRSRGALHPSEVHEVLAKLLALTVSRLEAVGIEYCLIGGGCIGIARHSGQMIPWDDDLDLAVWVDDIPKVIAALSGLPAPYGLHHEPPGATPFCRVTDRSTRLIGPDGSEWSIGIFLDLIPMMAWGSMGSIRLNQMLQGFEPRDRVRFSRQRWKRVVKRLIYACRAERAVIAARDRVLCPQFIAEHQRRRSHRGGIVSGTIQTPWVGRYPWSTMFPTVPRELMGVRVQTPHDIQDFLVRRYGRDHSQIPPPERRWGHYSHAVRAAGA